MARFNRWQSCKWSGTFESVEAEVRGLDRSALNLQFQLAWLALTAEATEFFQLLDGALAVGQIEPWMAREWPIFREMRQDARFAAALNKNDGVNYDATTIIENEQLIRLLLNRAKSLDASGGATDLPDTTIQVVESQSVPEQELILEPTPQGAEEPKRTGRFGRMPTL
jgi:hypothetical protein